MRATGATETRARETRTREAVAGKAGAGESSCRLQNLGEGTLEGLTTSYS